MRTTLTIDDDVLAAAKALAARQNKSIGEVISALTRQALKPTTTQRHIRNGVPLPLRSLLGHAFWPDDISLCSRPNASTPHAC